MKLNRLIIIFLIILGLIVGLIGGIFYYSSSLNSMEDQVSENLLALSESRADHIEGFFGRLITEIEIAATHSELSQEELAEIRDLGKNIHSLYILNKDGKIIVSSGETPIGNDLCGNDVFVKGRSKTTLINRYQCKTFGLEMMAIATPFKGGVLVARIETEKDLKEIVLRKTGLGETGEVLIAIKEKSGEPYFLFERRFEKEALTNEELSPESAEPMKQALDRNEKVFKESLDYRNEKVIAASQYIPLGEIGLVAKVDRNEIIGNYRESLIRNSLLVGIFVVIISFIAGILITRFILKPVEKLNLAVQEVSKGNFNIQLEKSNLEEIQSLTDSLSRVLASMKLAILKTGMKKGDMGVGEKLKEEVKETPKEEPPQQTPEEEPPQETPKKKPFVVKIEDKEEKPIELEKEELEKKPSMLQQLKNKLKKTPSQEEINKVLEKNKEE